MMIMSPRIVVVAASVALASCSQIAAGPETGSAASSAQQAKPVVAAAKRPAPADLASLADAHKAKPTDAAAAIAYARALRASAAKKEALAMLDKVAHARPNDRALTRDRGLLALELGDAKKAEQLLGHVLDPKAPDWRVHSALGAALAAAGKQQEAQIQFARALALAPDHPSILNNLALSYALDGKADEAERLLRKADKGTGVAPQVRQNLALVLGLSGKYDDAKRVAAASLPEATASANVGYLKKLADSRTARSARVDSEPAGGARSASLPQPAYQLGGPHQDR
jgi:Flp pilus assembly protein TadD